MVKLIAPLGCTAPVVATPVIVAVKIVGVVMLGLAEALRVIVGAWALRVIVVAVAEALA